MYATGAKMTFRTHARTRRAISNIEKIFKWYSLTQRESPRFLITRSKHHHRPSSPQRPANYCTPPKSKRLAVSPRTTAAADKLIRFAAIITFRQSSSAPSSRAPHRHGNRTEANQQGRRHRCFSYKISTGSSDPSNDGQFR